MDRITRVWQVSYRYNTGNVLTMGTVYVSEIDALKHAAGLNDTDAKTIPRPSGLWIVQPVTVRHPTN
jgi:hypothetical protein